MTTRVFTKTVLIEKLESELKTALGDLIDSTSYETEDSKVTVYLSRDPSLQEDTDLSQIVNTHVPTIVRHRVEYLIEPLFSALPIYKVDFTSHLQKNIVLAKSTYKALNGRPEYAEYTKDGELIAKIDWEFIDSPGGLYQERKLWLSYYLENGNEGEQFLIEHEIIDFTIPNQLEKSIKERVIARDAIVGEIKAVCSGALQIALQETLENIVALIQPFWNAFETERHNFIELATQDWLTAISAIDTQNEYTWLNTPVDGNGTTCKDYMLYRLSY